MNAVKAFFELNWTPFLENMCEIMGFKSENAKSFAKTCKDHHVAWQLLLTFHTSALQEMLIPFVRENFACKEDLTVENYFKYYKANQASNPNYAYLNLQVCRFSQAIINFRMGIRRNNANLVASAKFHLKERFYGRFHPHYQNIEIFDSIQYHLMPAELLSLGNPSEYGTKFVDIEKAIASFRPVLRKYLLNPADHLVSVSGEKLHPSLPRFLELATAKRIQKINTSVLGEPTPEGMTEPVYITENEEKNHRRKLSKKDLAKKILEILPAISDDIVRAYYVQILKSLQDENACKDSFVTLLHELNDMANEN
ncbi:hypothetical protein FSP39_005806 [Pinctada imbricata]|uniref:Uncharacterized protein n=1 Tax=Pinctada imbricata TaxID=66713 RepID=A0AA88XHY9_PINIB|nr:hypothetical protein FSP39_005806 [Pinctada imbricata]